MDGEPIVALASAQGRGAIAVLRVSGRGSGAVLQLLTGRRRFVPRVATLVDVTVGEGLVDRALATWFPAPGSYTGEDAFELALHGSPVLVAAALAVLDRQGVRQAQPGEFTARAFLNGKVDLVEAEAVDDLVRAVTPAQARIASAHLRGALSGPLDEIARGVREVLERLEASLDFPDEGYHFIDQADLSDRLATLARRCEALAASGQAGRMLREGASVVLTGRPNVGKSSLFNALLGASRAIVTDRPGTTRDVLRETLDLGGVPVTLTDTAGLRRVDEEAEREGVARAEASARDAHLVMLVIDAADEVPAHREADRRLWAGLDEQTRLLVVNKVDLAGRAEWPGWATDAQSIGVSALTGAGLDVLRSAVAARLAPAQWEEATITNVRHLGLLRRTLEFLRRAQSALRDGATEEYVAIDVRDALQSLEEISGRVTADDLLAGIFGRFCIGK